MLECLHDRCYSLLIEASALDEIDFSLTKILLLHLKDISLKFIVA